MLDLHFVILASGGSDGTEVGVGRGVKVAVGLAVEVMVGVGVAVTVGRGVDVGWIGGGAGVGVFFTGVLVGVAVGAGFFDGGR